MGGIRETILAITLSNKFNWSKKIVSTQLFLIFMSLTVYYLQIIIEVVLQVTVCKVWDCIIHTKTKIFNFTTLDTITELIL